MHYVSIIFQKILVDNTKTTRLYWYIYDFSVNYNSSDVDDILDIHNIQWKSLILNNVLIYWINVY